MISMSERPIDDHAAFYLVGAGIASLAAAAFLTRDGDIPGHNITILEESEKIVVSGFGPLGTQGATAVLSGTPPKLIFDFLIDGPEVRCGG
jgi:myosin-crossreactive antigen